MSLRVETIEMRLERETDGRFIQLDELHLHLTTPGCRKRVIAASKSVNSRL